MKLYIIRHGETDWNKQGLWQGTKDIPLNEKGKAQAQAIARRLEGIRVARIYSSPLARAYQTAEAINSSKGLEIIKDDDLKEITFGKWEGLNKPTIMEKYPGTYEEWRTYSFAEKNTPFMESIGAETYFGLQARAIRCVRRIVAHEDGDLILLTHGAWIHCFLCNIMNICTTSPRVFLIGNTSLNIVDYDKAAGRFVIETLNEVYHLREGFE